MRGTTSSTRAINDQTNLMYRLFQLTRCQHCVCLRSQQLAVRRLIRYTCAGRPIPNGAEAYCMQGV